nr:molybdenum cofactor biosynthesis protein B [Caldisphaera lagunensis]
MARFALIVTSDSVYNGIKKDEITPIVEKMLKEYNQELVFKTIIKNNKEDLINALNNSLNISDIILVTGGTGISPKDISIDVVKSIAQKELPGFGEIHRMKSFNDVGYRVVLSRASAFIINKNLVAVSPGNPSAVKISLEILISIANHAVEQLSGKPHDK